MCRLARTAAALAALPLLAGAAVTNTTEMQIDPDYQQNMGLCVLDVSTATFFLGQAGLLINAGVKVCRRIDVSEAEGDLVLAEREKAACSATITYVVAAFSYAASFLAAAATQCANTLDLPAYCASDVSGFMGSLALLAHAGSSLRDVCSVHSLDLDPAEAAFARNDVIDRDRRLQARAGAQAEASRKVNPETALLRGIEAKDPEAIVIRQADIAECVFDVGQATFFLARAGAAVNAAVRDCFTSKLRTEGRPGQAQCSVDINGVIGSFSFVASMVSFAVSKCPILINVHAQCAGEIVNLIAGLSGVAATASGFKKSCGVDGMSRRLSPEFSVVAGAAAPADAPAAATAASATLV